MVTACSASRRPAGVSRTRRPSGSIRAAPTSRASTAICCDTVEVVTPSSSATARIEPCRDSSSSSCSRRVSIRQLFRFADGMSMISTWTRTVWPGCTGVMTCSTPLSPLPSADRGPRRQWRGAGRRGHALRAARAGRLGRLVRPGRPGGCRVAPAGLGRRAAGRGGPAATVAVHPVRPAGLRRARGGDRRAHPASSWRRWPGCPSARPARWSSSARWASPWPAGAADACCGRRSRPSVSCCSPSRGTAGDRPGRGGVRAGRRGLLGGLHPAHPAGRRRGDRPAGTRRLDAGGRDRRQPGGRTVRRRSPDLGTGRHRARAGRAAAGDPVQPGVAGPASAHRRQRSAP